MTGKEIAEIVLEYLKVFLSSQMIIGIVAVVFLLVFRKAIKALIQRIIKFKLPGGSEIFASQAERTKEENASLKEKPPDVPIIDPDSLTLSKDDIDKLKAYVDAERARAAFWEYEYLNLYLVPNTQIILEWLSKLPQPTTIPLFDSIWSTIIPNAPEREAIFNALTNHHLIIVKNSLIEVTPKGHEYIKVRRPRTI
jgi:hypothetical protein